MMEAFKHGVDKPKALQRDNNYLFGHGSYISDWVVPDKVDPQFIDLSRSRRPVFEQVAPISEAVARLMIAERLAGFSASELGGLMNDDVRTSYVEAELDGKLKPEFWMVPSNKEFVIIASDSVRYCYGIYRHDMRFALIRGEKRHIEAYAAERVSRWGEHANESRLWMALNNDF